MTIRTVLLNPHLHEWWGNTNHEPKDIYPGRMKVDAPPGYCFKLAEQSYYGRWPALFMIPKRGDIFLSLSGEALVANKDHSSSRFLLRPIPSSPVSGVLGYSTTIKDIYKKDNVDIPNGYTFGSFGLQPQFGGPPHYYLDTKEVVRYTDNPAGLIPKIWLIKLPTPKPCDTCNGKGYKFDSINLEVLLCNDCGVLNTREEAKQAFINDLT